MATQPIRRRLIRRLPPPRRRTVRPVAIRRALAGSWLWPTASTRITTAPEPGHLAFDIGARTQGRAGDPIWSPTTATVEQVRNEPGGYGLNVRLRAASGEQIIFGHLLGLAPGIVPGRRLVPGQVVALMGGTLGATGSGSSSGVHTHYEIRRPGPDTFRPGSGSTLSALDPRAYYPAGYTAGSFSGDLPPLSEFNYLLPELPPQELIPLPPLPPLTIQGSQAPASVYQVSQLPASGAVTTTEPAEAPIKVAHTPLGDISIPRPGKLATRWIAFGIGAWIVLFSVFALIGKGAGAVVRSPLADVASDFIPGGGTVKTAARIVRKAT